MRDVMRRIRGVTVAVVMATLCTPAYSADPLTLLLLRLVRDKIISAGIESAVDSVSRQQSASRQQSRMPPQPTPNVWRCVVRVPRPRARPAAPTARRGCR